MLELRSSEVLFTRISYVCILWIVCMLRIFFLKFFDGDSLLLEGEQRSYQVQCLIYNFCVLSSPEKSIYASTYYVFQIYDSVFFFPPCLPSCLAWFISVTQEYLTIGVKIIMYQSKILQSYVN